MAYIGSSPTKVVSRQSANIFTYTATANQTAFTGSDANGNTLACTPSDIMVHMNGLRLEESDFTATTTTVTLGSGAAAGDEVTITAFVTFETADAYTKSASDTRYVNTSGDTMTGNLTASVGITIADDNNLKFGDGTAYIQGSGANDRLKFIANNTEHMRVHSAGYVTMPNQPSFYAYRAGSNYTTTNAAWEKLLLDGTRWNTGSHFSTTNNRFTAPVNGVYHFDGGVNRYFLPVGTIFRVALRVNGSEYVYGQVDYSGGTGDLKYVVSSTVKLDANDYVELWSYVNTTNTNGFSGGTSWNTFSGHLVG